MKKYVLCMLVLLFATAALVPALGNEQGDVRVLEIKGEINKATEKIITDAVMDAGEQGSYAFVLALDTPGGRSDSMLNIVEAIQASDIPILFYVSPKGAIAASAGTFIAMGCNLVGMAPLTTIGAAQPILGYDPTTGELIEAPQKIREYYTAIMRSYAEEHGRDPDIAAQFVSENLSLTPDEALDLGMCDVKADTVEDFVASVDGMEVRGTVQGEKMVLSTKDIDITYIGLSLKDRIMIAISNPNIAYLLTTVGILGLVFGFMSPGWHVPEVIGAVCLGLAVVANGYVGFEYGGLILMVLGIALFAIEAMTPSVGLYAAGGTISFVLGSLFLFSGTDGGQGRFFDEGTVKMFWTNVAVMTILIAGFLIFGLQAALKLRMTRPTTGLEQMYSETGIVEDPIDPQGTVRIRGELWNARADGPIEKGTIVRVQSIDGLTLIVEIKDKGGETTDGRGK